MAEITNVVIEKIYLSEGHDFKGRFGQERLRHGVKEVSSVECVAGKGLVGDRYFGYRDDFKGQIAFIDRAAVDRVWSEVGEGEVDPSAFRRNVVMSGIDLKSLVGKRFSIGDVVFSGSEECAPCFWMDGAIGTGAEALLKGSGGLRCRIESSGTLASGNAALRVLD